MSPDEGFGFQDTDESAWAGTDESAWGETVETVEFPPDINYHRNVLKLLMPIELQGVFDDFIEVVGKQLDDMQTRSDDLLTEIFPGTTSELLSRWEEVYGITVDETRPYYLRIQFLLAKVRARGAISKAFMQKALLSFIGYEPVIENYHVPRCDDPFTLTDDEKFAMEDALVYRFTVYIDNAIIQTAGYSAVDVQRIINIIKPAYSNGILDTGVYGFFCDDVDSLTNLTLLAI